MLFGLLSQSYGVSALLILAAKMSSMDRYSRRHEKTFTEQMCKRTHFNEAEIERLVAMHKNALVGYGIVIIIDNFCTRK